jgi:hypothetical protein
LVGGPVEKVQERGNEGLKLSFNYYIFIITFTISVRVGTYNLLPNSMKRPGDNKYALVKQWLNHGNLNIF